MIYERERGWFTTAPFSEPEIFTFPEGIGPLQCVNVEHEEVLLMPRWLDAKRVTFKYGLGDEFIGILKTLNQLGLDKTAPIRVRSADGPVMVSPRDVVAAGLPDPADRDRTPGVHLDGVVGVDGLAVEVALDELDDLSASEVDRGIEGKAHIVSLALILSEVEGARGLGAARPSTLLRVSRVMGSMSGNWKGCAGPRLAISRGGTACRTDCPAPLLP